MKSLKSLREFDVVYMALLLSIVPNSGGKRRKCQKDQFDRHEWEDFSDI